MSHAPAAPPAAPPRLTPRQRAVYGWIYETTRRQGYQPSGREVMAHFGIRSPNGVANHLFFLARKGYLDLAGGESRSIRFRLRPDGRPFVGWSEPDTAPTPGDSPCCNASATCD